MTTLSVLQEMQCPKSEVRITMIGHPERNLPRFARQTESKDLHLFFNELHTDLICGVSALSRAVLAIKRLSSSHLTPRTRARSAANPATSKSSSPAPPHSPH